MKLILCVFCFCVVVYVFDFLFVVVVVGDCCVVDCYGVLLVWCGVG